MTAEQIAGRLLIAGSTVFGVGAAIGVPRVFTGPDAEGRLRMLELHRRLWRVAQPPYGTGAIVASLAVGYLASDSADGRSPNALRGACVALLTGALAWGWSLCLRGTRIAALPSGRCRGGRSQPTSCSPPLASRCYDDPLSLVVNPLG